MDNFIDKLSQKFNAEELIRANTQAENAQMESLQLQVAEYEKVLQEMRKLNYKNVELSEKMEELFGENSERVANIQVDEMKLLQALRAITDEQTKNVNEIAQRDERIEEQKEIESKEAEIKAKQNLEAVEELFKKSDDFSHKENVKVYRNVQAVVVEELKKQTEEQQVQLKSIKTKSTIGMIFSILTFILAAAGVAAYVLVEMGMLVF